jgi:hypothetical protein
MRTSSSSGLPSRSRPLLAQLLCLVLLTSCPCRCQHSVEVDARSSSSSPSSRSRSLTAGGAAELAREPLESTRVAAASDERDENAGVVGAAEAAIASAPWRDVLQELRGRPYALVYDEPDNLLRLDRSEISAGLVFVSLALLCPMPVARERAGCQCAQSRCLTYSSSLARMGGICALAHRSTRWR